MSIQCVDMPLISSVLTDEFIEAIQTEEQMLCASKLLITLIEKTIRCFLAKELRHFDANAGDDACHLQSLELHRLIQLPTLVEEAKSLQKINSTLKRTLQSRYQKKLEPTKTFFNKEFQAVRCSEDMCALLRLFLLTTTKVTDKIDPHGRIFTKTDPGRLSSLSSTYSTLIPKEHKQKLINELAARQAYHSIKVIRKVIQSGSNALAQTMLEESQIRYRTFSGFAPKPFSSVFFHMEVLLEELKAREAIVAFKSTVKKGIQPCYFFFQASSQGFKPIQRESLKNEEIPIFVFKAVIPETDSFLQQVETIGFEEMVLMSAAQCPPFGPNSSLEDIQIQEAKERILSFQHQASSFGLDSTQKPFFLMDHIYCDILKFENPGK